MPLLELKRLSMRFGGLAAVRDLDAAVETGEIFSLIGPNGAGKTTVFNVVTGLYEPTTGDVNFNGAAIIKPLTRRVVAACLAIGLATALFALLLSVNVDRLWRATIKRRAGEFTYAEALANFRGYFRGAIAIDQEAGRWLVVSADARHVLGSFRERDPAEQARDGYNAILEGGELDAAVVARDGNWQFITPREGGVAATFDSAAAAESRLAMLRAISADRRATRIIAPLACVVGFLVGSAGAWAVWRRSRRTPDVIALGGVARTFQNIRLFQNMTVVENVLLGLDRTLRAGVARMMFRTPRVRAEEAAAFDQALELLKFVGLGSKAGMLAKNLPYGDQRRLEIARALATRPKLLLLDEPAAGMNPAETADLMELIRRIRDTGITILLIEHHMNLVMGISDRIAVLDYGEKIATGTPAEIRVHPQVIAAYLGTEEVT